MTNQTSNRLDLDHMVTRRKFIGTAALSGAALLGGGFFGQMARPLRIESPGAIYHVLSRGDRREAIFRHDADRKPPAA